MQQRALVSVPRGSSPVTCRTCQLWTGCRISSAVLSQRHFSEQRRELLRRYVPRLPKSSVVSVGSAQSAVILREVDSAELAYS
eukprot:5295124-Pleurochrysis_carterae.AAC.1